MTNFRSFGIITLTVLAIVAQWSQVDGKILAQCDAVKELQRAGVSRTLMSNWICLIKHESNFNTSLVTGPKGPSTYSYGIFQINSLKWCARGRKGGKCNKRCEEFSDDDIQDDIVCANTILATDGFKQWNNWLKKCKGQALPDISKCKRRRSI